MAKLYKDFFKIQEISETATRTPKARAKKAADIDKAAYFCYRSYMFLKNKMKSTGLFLRASAAAKLAAFGRRTPKQVVFVSDFPRTREAKLAYGLKHAGWQVILLHRKAPTFDANKYYAEIHRYRDPREALRLASKYRPVAYHVFSLCKYEVATIFIRHKPGKIVFDDYDVMAGMMKESFARKEYPGQLERERFCLRNADGLCCRHLETQYAKRYMGYKYRGKRILFPEYCWDFPNLSQPGNRSPDDPIHIVYCGSMAIEKLHDPALHGRYFYLEFARALTENKIHFHLYPGHQNYYKNFEDDYSEYLSLARETPYFHLHRPLPPEQLIKEMSRYDFGEHTIGKKDWTGENCVYNPVKDTHNMSNKIFDYIDAGLGIISYNCRLEERLVRREGLGIIASREETGPALRARLDQIKEEVRKKTAPARKKYSIHNQINRLAEFYLAV